MYLGVIHKAFYEVFFVKMPLTLQTGFVHIRIEQSCDLGNKYSVWFLKTDFLQSSVKGILITLRFLCFPACKPIIVPRQAVVGMAEHCDPFVHLLFQSKNNKD